MSVDIAWDLITSGNDGKALAESIRAFIHMKFQQVTLPRFISAVDVHSFEFGSACPEIHIKDICDPLPDFYEDDEDDVDESPAQEDMQYTKSRTERNVELRQATVLSSDLQSRNPTLDLDDATNRLSALPVHSSAAFHARDVFQSSNDPLAGLLNRSGTPGIPGGTTNMGYFHFPIGGRSGAQTPLAAVAGGGGPFATAAWLRDQQTHHPVTSGSRATSIDADGYYGSSVVRPRTADSISSPELGSPIHPSSPDRPPTGLNTAEKVSGSSSTNIKTSKPDVMKDDDPSPSDLQVVAHVTYNGDIRMMLTAEIMLDYPMPSFVKIPLKLSITGMSFDGVAILAYIRSKMHFCFLDPEDADTLVGSSFAAEDSARRDLADKRSKLGSLLREIQVETEIGRQESGKQVLKNVGKVERFVLEEVRRIFEDEFVFPSFWTFLV